MANQMVKRAVERFREEKRVLDRESHAAGEAAGRDFVVEDADLETVKRLVALHGEVQQRGPWPELWGNVAGTLGDVIDHVSEAYLGDQTYGMDEFATGFLVGAAEAWGEIEELQTLEQ